MMLIFNDFRRDYLWGNPRSYIVVQEDLQEEKAAHETEMLRSHSADKDMSLI